jgi:hypothetical protein
LASRSEANSARTAAETVLERIVGTVEPTTGNPPAGAGGNGHRQGHNAASLIRCQI